MGLPNLDIEQHYELFLRAFDPILVDAYRRQARILAFTSHQSGAGVSTCVRGIAASLLRSGAKPECLNLSGELGASASALSRISDGAALHPDAKAFASSDIGRIRAALGQSLGNYDFLIVDLPPIGSGIAGSANPFAVAAACDLVFLVCQRGRSTLRSLEETKAKVSQGDLSLAGVLVNDFGYVSPGKEIARKLNKIRWLAPKSVSRLQRKLEDSYYLS